VERSRQPGKELSGRFLISILEPESRSACAGARVEEPQWSGSGITVAGARTFLRLACLGFARHMTPKTGQPG
jgi:hypothetical protein